MAQTLKVIGQAILLISIGLQFFIANTHNREDAKLEVYQSRLWKAEHRVILKEQTLSVVGRGFLAETGLQKNLEKQRAKRFEKERAARASLIRASIRAIEVRNKIAFYEKINAILFVLGSFVLLVGEALLIRVKKATPAQPL